MIEIGTAWGGSALYWAHVLRDLGPTKSRVFTMDIEDNTKRASAGPLWKDYVTFYKGSSTDPDIVAKIAQEPRSGPHGGGTEILAEGGKQTFQQDLSREAFVMTFQPGGWLRKN